MKRTKQMLKQRLEKENHNANMPPKDDSMSIKNNVSPLYNREERCVS